MENEIIRAAIRTTARFILKYLLSRAVKFIDWLFVPGRNQIGPSKGATLP
jgi:hypothetical protein